MERGCSFCVLKQVKLPAVTEYNPKKNVEDIFYAIKNMELRGAPLIGEALFIIPLS